MGRIRRGFIQYAAPYVSLAPERSNVLLRALEDDASLALTFMARATLWRIAGAAYADATKEVAARVVENFMVG